MNARIRISLSSASVCTSAAICSRLSSITSPGFAHARSEQGAAARDHVHLAGELTRRVDDDQRLDRAVRADDLDLTRGHDEERHDLRAGFDEHLALLDRSRPSVRRDARDLRRRQRGKDVLEARVNFLRY